MPDAAYYRKWRREHPEYRKRQVELRKKRRQEKGRGDRSAEYKRAYERRKITTGDNGWCLESCIVAKAKHLALRVKRPDHRTYVYDDCYEDLVGVCVVSLCEGSDPFEAMRRFMSERSRDARLRAPLLGELKSEA